MCTLGFRVVSCYQYNIIVLNKLKKLILVENTDKVKGIGYETSVSWTISFIKSKDY